MTDMEYWKLRHDWARFNNQPMYLTADEWAELREVAFTAACEEGLVHSHGRFNPLEMGGSVSRLMAVPVVIERDLAHGQKLALMDAWCD